MAGAWPPPTVTDLHTVRHARCHACTARLQQSALLLRFRSFPRRAGRARRRRAPRRPRTGRRARPPAPPPPPPPAPAPCAPAARTVAGRALRAGRRASSQRRPGQRRREHGLLMGLRRHAYALRGMRSMRVQAAQHDEQSAGQPAAACRRWAQAPARLHSAARRTRPRRRRRRPRAAWPRPVARAGPRPRRPSLSAARPAWRRPSVPPCHAAPGGTQRACCARRARAPARRREQDDL